MADITRNSAIEHSDNQFAESSLDLVHLSRQTMGDSKLEQEILVLFLLQCQSCEDALLSPTNTGQLTDVAHQMKGCAKAVGAWDIAQTAGLLEKNPDKKHLILKLHDQLHLVKKYLKFLTKPVEISDNLH